MTIADDLPQSRGIKAPRNEPSPAPPIAPLRHPIARPRSNAPTLAHILTIATATPPALPQSTAATVAESLGCSTDKQRSFLHRVFSRSGVSARGCVLIDGSVPESDPARYEKLLAFYRAPQDESDGGPTTAARMERYAYHAPRLAEKAARRALSSAHIEPAQITHLISVSCTGFVAPGIDTHLIQALDLPAGVQRLHIGFMGCHAAFNALAAAHAIVRGAADATVLVVAVELSSLHFAYGFDPGRLVANALFADGAAAAIIAAPRAAEASLADARLPASPAPAWSLRASASRLLSDTAAAMTWRIQNHGFAMTLSPELPAIVQTHLRPFVEHFLAQHNLAIADIQHWAVHPGGPKILAAAATSLGLPDAALGFSYGILAAHGNMSSATMLFILKKMAEDLPPDTGLCVAIGIGPGLMLEAMLLERSSA